MMNVTKTIGVGLLAAAVTVSGMLPVTAAPFARPDVKVSSDVQQVQMDVRRMYRGDRYRSDRYRGRDFHRRGDNYFYNGYRGYRHHRRGYREFNGWWFPLAAFTAGALITGAINQPGVRVRGGNAHVEWCYNRYRSYRAWDNTFQPYNGPRRQCYSPYS